MGIRATANLKIANGLVVFVLGGVVGVDVLAASDADAAAGGAAGYSAGDIFGGLAAGARVRLGGWLRPACACLLPSISA